MNASDEGVVEEDISSSIKEPSVQIYSKQARVLPEDWELVDFSQLLKSYIPNMTVQELT